MSLALLGQRPASTLSPQHLNKPSRFSKKSWQLLLQKELADLERLYPDHFGVFLKDLNTGEEISHRAQENWYLASTVKIPIAIVVLQDVDSGKIALDQIVQIQPEDYVDGNGPLNSLKAGTSVTIRYLIEQMLTLSDNTASDILIDLVGLDRINALIHSISPTGFSTVTTLKNVRRHIYSEIHPRAFELSGTDFISLRKVSRPQDRVHHFAKRLEVDDGELLVQNLEQAYDEYYRKGLNSGMLGDYGRLLNELWSGNLLKASSRDFLIGTLLKTKTGRHRVTAGLRSPFIFAHKTGTQQRRILDVGFVLRKDQPQKPPIVLVASVRNLSDAKSEKILKRIGELISEAGL